MPKPLPARIALDVLGVFLRRREMSFQLVAAEELFVTWCAVGFVLAEVGLADVFSGGG